jgi:hypothetical protein
VVAAYAELKLRLAQQFATDFPTITPGNTPLSNRLCKQRLRMRRSFLMDATLEAFLAEYARRTNTHQFAAVAPLIAADAVYWFSDGSHRGLDSTRV